MSRPVNIFRDAFEAQMRDDPEFLEKHERGEFSPLAYWIGKENVVKMFKEWEEKRWTDASSSN